MAGREISAIKIKKLRYGAVLTAAPTSATLAALFKAATEVKNAHQDTFAYEETAPTTTPYKNQLTGQVYRTDVEPGDVKMKFTVGSYDLATKAELQGGVATDKDWKRGSSKTPIYKSMFGVTEDDVLIVFPKATVVASGTDADKAIGLGVVAMPNEISSAIGSEYWFDVQGVDLEAAVQQG